MGKGDRSLGTRCHDLVAKLLSVKFLIFTAATILLAFDKIDAWVWLLTAVALMGMRYFEKVGGIR